METEVILENVKTVEELDAQREAFLEQMRLEDNKYLLKRGQLVKEARERQRKEEQDFRDDLAKTIYEEYNVYPREAATLIVDRAWDEGHSYGYDEVKSKAHSLANFVEKITKLVEEICE